MDDEESVWQDIRRGDLIALPRGEQGLVIAVLPGGEPAPENATVTVLTAKGIVQFAKAVLCDKPLLARPPADQLPAMAFALQKLPSNPDPGQVIAVLESVLRPPGHVDWVKLGRRLDYLAKYGR